MLDDDAQRIERAVNRGGVIALAVTLMLGALMIGMLSNFQRKIVFPGAQGVDLPLVHRFAREVGATELQLPTGDGETLYGWHRTSKLPGERRVVLYFHGNASSVLGQLDLQEALTHAGWDFVETHYRGYPGSSGIATESTVNYDAEATWDWIVDELGVPRERIVVHGRSLGGGVAANLAATVSPGALVLESTFTSVLDLASQQFRWLPVNRILEHRFMTRDLVPDIHCPVLVAHGTGDHTIPVAHGRELARLFETATYIEVPRIDHNDILFDGAYRAEYLDFLDQAVPRSVEASTGQP